MRTYFKTLIVLLSLFPLIALSGLPSEVKTKIVIQASAAENLVEDAPCFIVYPEGENLKSFEESGAIPKLEKTLRSMGYTLVPSENEAAVFIRVGYATPEPYLTELTLKQRPSIDYSNASSTRNYAAMMKGGRYQQLANPQSAENQQNPGAILGPSGEIIVLSEQEANAPKVIKGEESVVETMVYPIVFEVSAWRFEKAGDALQAQQLWAVVASYNNLRDEEIEPQLLDLCKATTRFFGKQLDKPKSITRK